MRLAIVASALALFIMPAAAQPEPPAGGLRGHGGPVRSVAVSPDGVTAISGSFDTSAILWDLSGASARQVLRFHDGSVNAVAALPGGRFATGGEEGRIALWEPGTRDPIRVLDAHTGPIVSLAAAPDGASIASASWDGTARITPLDGSAAHVLAGHQGNVNGVAFAPGGRVVTAGYDATLRVWRDGEPERVITLPSALNAVVAAPDGELIAAGADGLVRILAADGSVRAEVVTQNLPVIALALSPDGRSIAAASIRGSVALIDRASAKLRFTLVGPGLPVWSVTFTPDGEELITGGGDRLVRRWDAHSGEPIGPLIVATPEDPLARFTGSRGAEVFRACAACHTLTADGGNRAGPTLHGIFGRRIASAPGYAYSEAFKTMDIVWTRETVSKLFEIGPSHYTPGTKMPEQVVRDPEDRAALMDFLEEATR